jgi:hypothetical protein
MMIQNRDDTRSEGPGRRQSVAHKRAGYYAAVPAKLLDHENTIIDDLIGFAFDTLGACRLQVRVYDETATNQPCYTNPM